MLAIYVQSSSAASVWDLLFVACIVALVAASHRVQSPIGKRTLFGAAIGVMGAVGAGIASAFPTAYCDWFFKALGYCK
jgi:hypothetical protein